MFTYTEVLEAIPRLEDDPEDGSLSLTQQAARLGTSVGLIRRAIANGLSPYQADNLIVKGLGLHPATLYGIEAWILADDIVLDESGQPDGREGVEALRVARASRRNRATEVA